MIWYLVLTVFTIFIYVMFSIYNKREKKSKKSIPNETSKKSLDERLLLSNIGDNIMKCKEFVSSEDFDALLTAYHGLEDCFQSSQPFGEIQLPAILAIENQVVSKMTEINSQVMELQHAGSQKRVATVSIVTSLEIIKGFLLNKERLI